MLIRKIIKNRNFSIYLYFYKNLRISSSLIHNEIDYCLHPIRKIFTNKLEDFNLNNNKLRKLNNLSLLSSSFSMTQPSSSSSSSKCNQENSLASSSSSQSSKLPDTDYEFDIMDNFSNEHNINNFIPSEIDKKFCLKNILYASDVNDELLQKLNICESFEDLLQIFTNQKNDFHVKHLVQITILLWNLQRISINSSNGSSSGSCNQNEIINENLINSESFQMYLNELYKHKNEMNLNELTCCFLYLNKFGIDVSHRTMKTLLQEILDRISNANDVDDVDHHAIPLTALSRFTVAISTCNDFYTYFICKDVIPHIIKKLQICNTSDEIRLITICMYNLYKMITNDLFDMYTKKIQNLIETNAINEQTQNKCLLKIINFLNFPNWSNECTQLIRDLFTILTKNYEERKYSIRDIEIMFRLFQTHLEPASLIPKLSKISENLLTTAITTNTIMTTTTPITNSIIIHDDHDDGNDLNQQQQNIPELFACIAYFSKPSERSKMIDLSKKFIDNIQNYKNLNTITSLFIILRSLKISDHKICDTYWLNILKMFNNNNNFITNTITNQNTIIENNYYKLIRYCHHYMHFNNNLGGTYRNRNFEKQISKIIMKDFFNYDNNNDNNNNNNNNNYYVLVIPSKFSKLASFIIAYGYKTDKMNLPNFIIEKIENMSNQFTIIDCLQLSRGLQIAFELRYRHYIPPEVAQQFLKIENILNACAERHLKHNHLNLSDLNCIIRSLTNRKASRKTHLYKLAIEKYKTVHNAINSRTIRDVSFNLMTSRYIIPEIIDKMFEYILKNKDYITGDTVEKIIYCSYNLGYIPQTLDDIDETLYWAAEIIKRDFEFMTGLSIVQACLALSFYKILPESLINKTFNINFIHRLEEEIQMCYSKATYPDKILNQVMQLNRSICLDFPESQVPWFQQNYIEAQMSKKPIIQTHFHHEIKKMLISVLKSEQFLQCNHLTPYGYNIDFVIHLDKNKKPLLPAPKESAIMENLTKIAIIPLRLDAFCQNDSKYLRGQEQLMIRHLEMLGYKVIHINLNDWNSMYMNVPGAKMNYLKGLLQIE